MFQGELAGYVRIRGLLVLWTFLVLNGATVCHAEAVAHDRGDFQGGLRLVWSWYMNEHPEWYPAFKAAGFNAIVVNAHSQATPKWWQSPIGLQHLTPPLDAVAKNKLHAYAQISIGGDIGVRIGRRAVTRQGTLEEGLACQLDPAWWGEYLIPAIESLARMSMEQPALRGVLIDTEQYGGKETSGALSNIYCFCDDCFLRFLLERKLGKEIPARAQRAAWLESRTLLTDYHLFLQNQMESRTKELADRLAKIQPAFEIHFYSVDDSWYYRGLLRGLAERKLPVFVLDERTYGGYLPQRGKEMDDFLRAHNPRAVWAPGFYTKTLSARAIGINIRRVREENRPYWLYNEDNPFPEDALKAATATVGSERKNAN
ncbi:MAG: hypothetical protein HY360_21815 [Verrucomicrobia bacterium]|nr:hypothetical protein [Verrucomicrobiota bacterium]